ncbi:SDR family NAD(P)-dependent oxidoreductase [Streptomyces profundus]|uniref:SDR family NAD(P)-dependent oxidoreductase n=1 Tax=Streptomyces profundus TaxID=2867410 RepID=UPI001D1601A2|nr:SDR family NAD(P)-dependent oxidoreductase [Streptomyces sp. MA3_2.13]UED86499.1 SDR family NAD(P)-dependent oxidoreductase [Streptomyces sp. MA3_2.13]
MAEPTAAPRAGGVDKAPILRHLMSLAPLPAQPAPAEDALAGRTVLVLGGDDRFLTSVRAAVRAHGGRPAGWDEAAGGPDVDGPVDAIVDGGLPAGTPVAAGAWHAAMDRTVTALHHVYEDWARESDARRLHYLAVTSLGGAMGLTDVPDAQPLGGLWAGLAKTLPREFPACDVRVLDLAPSVDPGPAAVAELLGGRLLEVGHTAEGRHALLAHATEIDGKPIDLTPDDVLLMTGGARGIGFEFALAVALRTGCRVLVSGRTPLPADRPDWLVASAEAFAALERRAYAERDPDEPLHAVRRRLGRMAQLREVHHNLERARLAGAELAYHACEVTDPEQVAALVRAAGPGLSVVVHNAGIDLPKRLRGKSVDQFRQVIGVKVDGFLHLLAALADAPLKMLCAVGSLTGRYGGMVGQTDYAAANEGLARLALRAGQRRSHPVKVLAWPTWDGVGLITNLDAASRYMTPIGVADGVDAWLAEITREGSGEVCFMGEIGLVAPQHLRGIAVPSDWRGRTGMLSRRFFLGEVITYAPTATVVTEHRLDPTWASCLDEVRVAGAPGLPLSLALEYLLDGAGWLVPGGEPATAVALCDIAVRPGALRLDGGTLDLTREVRLEPGTVHRPELATTPLRGARVTLRRRGAVAAEATVLLTVPASSPTSAGSPTSGGEGAPAPAERTDQPAADGQGYDWLPYLVSVSPWRDLDGWRAEVEPIRPSEWFALVDPPHPRLPSAALEAAVAVSPVAPGARRGELWRAERLRLTGLDRRATALSLAGSTHRVLAADGGEVAELLGARWVSETP